jgi:hypothetical protein
MLIKFKRVLKSKRGSMLLHTVLMAVILATMGALILKWALARYSIVTKYKRKVNAKALIEACMVQKWAEWKENITPVDGTCTIDTYTVNVNVTDISETYYQVDFDVDYTGI